MARPATSTSLFISDIYLDEEIVQAELRRTLAEDNLTLLWLKSLVVRLITLTS
jgi:hypothetical protein